MDENKKELLKELQANRLYTFISNDWYKFDKYELKEIILALLGVAYDNATGNCYDDTAEQIINEQIQAELENRNFWED